MQRENGKAGGLCRVEKSAIVEFPFYVHPGGRDFVGVRTDWTYCYLLLLNVIAEHLLI